ncbi:MAG: universal stress protein [Acidimicrobiales bacterium]
MSRLRSILFCPLADRDNPSAARRATTLAAKHGAAMTMLGVVPEPARLSSLIHGRDHDRRLVEEARRSMEHKLSRCGIDGSKGKIMVGDPALTIIQEVLTSGHDLVVVSADDDHDHATIRRLLRKCPCPVWVIRPTRAKINRVLAAVNADPAEYDLNRRILELATDMNHVYGGELHVVHSWELYGEATMRGSSFVRTEPDELDAMLREEEAGHRAALDELLADPAAQGAAWTVHLVKGPAPSVVPDLVRRRRINLLVMGTVARTGISGLVMGNTAERILDEVRCSVVTVKPPGFVSPIGVPD